MLVTTVQIHTCLVVTHSPLPDSSQCSCRPTSCPASLPSYLHRPAWMSSDPFLLMTITSKPATHADKTQPSRLGGQPTAPPRPRTHYRYHHSASRTAASGGYSYDPRRPTTTRARPWRGRFRTAQAGQQPCGSACRAARRPAAARGR